MRSRICVAHRRGQRQQLRQTRPAPASRPIDTCRRSIPVARSADSCRGPLTTIQPSFICGSPAIWTARSSKMCSARLDSPRRGDLLESVIRENFVAKDRADPSDSRRSHSSGFRNDPVGLFGFTTTIARVRGVIAASSAREIDVPGSVVAQRILAHFHEFERRPEIRIKDRTAAA